MHNPFVSHEFPNCLKLFPGNFHGFQFSMSPRLAVIHSLPQKMPHLRRALWKHTIGQENTTRSVLGRCADSSLGVSSQDLEDLEDGTPPFRMRHEVVRPFGWRNRYIGGFSPTHLEKYAQSSNWIHLPQEPGTFFLRLSTLGEFSWGKLHQVKKGLFGYRYSQRFSKYYTPSKSLWPVLGWWCEAVKGCWWPQGHFESLGWLCVLKREIGEYL